MKAISLGWVFWLTGIAGWNADAASDGMFYSSHLHVRTNASAALTIATNLWSNGGEMDRRMGRELMLELGTAGYAPAALWLGTRYEQNEDPEGKIGAMFEAGHRGASSYVKVIRPGGGVVTYEGVNPYHERLVYWLRKAAELGNVEAQFKLGQHFLREANSGQTSSGTDNPAAREAAKWYGLAAANGDKRAKESIAGMYGRGYGVARNWVIAMQLYEECEAFYEMARLSLVNSNRVAAYTWWCVGNAREKPSKAAPFTSQYAAIAFSVAERVAGAQRGAAYLLQRYGGTNSVSIKR